MSASTSLSENPPAAGALAAKLLEDSCQSAMETRSSLHLEVVRDAAHDLRRYLEVIAGSGAASADLLSESALACADAANLAACAVPELPEKAVPAAVAATHLAVGAVRALRPLIEAAAAELEGERAEYALRDARSTSWRADLVIRQLEEATTEAD